MEALNVLVIVPSFDRTVPHADEEIMQRIAEVSQKINVRDGSALAHAEFHGDVTAREELNKMLAEAEVIYGLFLPNDLLSRSPKLKWMQTMSAGVDRFAGTDIWQTPVTITGVSGIHATPIGEFAIMFMLMFAKRAHIGFQMKH